MTQEEQIKRFKEGFPALDIVEPATVGRGIESLDEKALAESIHYSETAYVKGRCKFVPASGAASRMFKDVFAHQEDALNTLTDNLDNFAFYDEKVFGKAPYNPLTTADLLLYSNGGGLGYGAKPKGVLKFHRYRDEVRSALAEHLVEGQAYMRSADGSVYLTFTITESHRKLFEEELARLKPEYEKRYGVKYTVRFTCQDPATDTIAVTLDNKPFLKEDGTVLKRPAGHGALIHNLSQVDEELVSIKNIDNIAVERMLDTTAKYKKALMGRALQLRDQVRGLLIEFDQLTGVGDPSLAPDIPAYFTSRYDPYATPECQALCNRIEEFLIEHFCISMPEFRSSRERALALRAKLNRPLRVCGMVLNEGEKGGGPFIVRDKDGSTSLQILESSQIADRSLMEKSTHFNPVDIVCCLRDVYGEKFNLEDYTDPDTGFISRKSYEGRELKALELPGLWNGSMSNWLTSFIEVPLETFNPVKTVFDLLKPAHQGIVK